VLFFVAFLVIDFVASAIAFLLERRQPESGEEGWLLTQVWLQRFAYRQLFSIVLFKTLKRAVQGKPFAWDKLERTAALSFSPEDIEETERSLSRSASRASSRFVGLPARSARSSCKRLTTTCFSFPRMMSSLIF
jgi:ABC-type ATPase with predicted acetyltransferase domain